MTHEPFQLPEGIDYPKRFDRSRVKRVWFCEGAWDGIEGRPMTDQGALIQHQGSGAWDGYKAGYEAGQKRRQP